MDFKNIIQSLFSEAVNAFNSGNYNTLSSMTLENLVLTSPEIKSQEFYSPKIHCNNRQEVFTYWKEISANYKNQITSFEFISTGKKSIVRCHYEHLKMTIDAEVHIDEYGKTTKIINHLFSIK